MAPDNSETQGETQTRGWLPWLRRNFWGLVTVVGVTIICVAIVQIFKKPGQMSVIESQAMDMNAMVPPKGAVPVAIAKVERGAVTGDVTYTGTVRAFSDEDVYPRVTGRIASMPVYPGDVVRKGQVLVQLDAAAGSEYGLKREEAQNAEDAAMHNAGIAKEEFEQKKHDFSAAKEAEEAAKQLISEMESSVAYWTPEVARQESLLKSQVVSLDEYQKEVSELRSAEAKVRQAKAKLKEATSKRLSSQAELDRMVHHVGHGYSEAKKAQAAKKYAAVYESYTRIVAQDDGVVTQRLVSPGVVASPNMMLLKVAHVNKVRVQAEVASEDAARIRVGDKVFIKDAQDSKDELVASITSVFPAADPQSRTFTVESLVDNAPVRAGRGIVPKYRFLPGQYTIMRIATNKDSGLTVPTSAIVWREGSPQVWRVAGGGKSATMPKFQCPMHPEVTSTKAGKCPKCGMDLEPTSTKTTAAHSGYTCVMHPEVISQKPGDCPKCGMKLVAKEAKEVKEPSAQTKTQYTCTMHPEVISEKQGKCPKCGMDLTPKELGGRKIAELVQVEVGPSNSQRTLIVNGLNEADEVIFAGYANLQPGTAVVGTEWGASGPVTLPLASQVSGNRLAASNNFSHEETVANMKVTLSLSTQSSPKSIRVHLRKPDDTAINNAKVKIATSMPGMNMPGPDLNGTTDKDGKVEFKTDFMSGLWQFDVTVAAPGTEPVQMTLDAEIP
jgi:multidrug efflux pump subunit AcrA (membrane-fusion protein)